MQSFNGEKEISIHDISLMQSELLFSFELTSSPSDTIGIILENTNKEKLIIGYSRSNKQFYVDRRSAGISAFSKNFARISTAPYDARPSLKLHLFVDANSVELFVDDGRLVMTNLVFPGEKYTSLKLFSKGGSCLLNKAIFANLAGTWPKDE